MVVFIRTHSPDISLDKRMEYSDAYASIQLKQLAVAAKAAHAYVGVVPGNTGCVAVQDNIVAAVVVEHSDGHIARNSVRPLLLASSSG